MGQGRPPRGRVGIWGRGAPEMGPMQIWCQNLVLYEGAWRGPGWAEGSHIGGFGSDQLNAGAWIDFGVCGRDLY